VLIVDWDVHHGNGTQALVEGSIDPLRIHAPVSLFRDRRRRRARRRQNVFNVPRPPGLPREVYMRTCSRPGRRPWSGGGRTSCWSPPVSTRSREIRLGGFTLEPEDVATGPARFARASAPAPVVGVLEGGYRLDLLAPAARARARACLMVPASRYYSRDATAHRSIQALAAQHLSRTDGARRAGLSPARLREIVAAGRR